MDSSANSLARADDAALAWIARLRSDAVSDSDRQAFALWLAESDSNRKAMDAAEALWGELGAILDARPADAQPETGIELSGFSLRRWVPTAVAAAATLLLGILFWPDAGQQPAGEIYRTAMGERMDVLLPDGSRALLNTATVVQVAYDEDTRLVSLRRGQAWFSVEKNPQKPFVVDAGNTRITALGTAFDVYRHSETTEVTVTEGVVRVGELGNTGARAANTELLHAHQTLRAAAQGWEVKQQSERDIEQQLAWREGRLVAVEMPLGELITQLGRYDSTRYLLGSPGLAALTVSGVFELDQPQAILRALEVSLKVEAREINDDTVQLVKPGSPD